MGAGATVLQSVLLVEETGRGGGLAAEPLYPLDHPAGNFGACVAGGLGGKIVGMAMQDNHFPDDIIHQKPVGQKSGYRKAMIPKQRRQVAGVVRVCAISGVVMGHGVGEGLLPATPAVRALVDMEPENPPLARLAGEGKAGDFGIDHYAMIGLVKPYPAGYAGEIFAARYTSLGRRFAAQCGEKMDMGQTVHVQRSFIEMFPKASYADKGGNVRGRPRLRGTAMDL